jgi:hypothetical protein
MHLRIIMSHNVVTEINKILTHSKIDTPITICGDMLSIITYCAGSEQMTYKPIQSICPNPFPVWLEDREEICRGKS